MVDPDPDSPGSRVSRNAHGNGPGRPSVAGVIDLATIPQIDGDMTALAGHATAIAAAGVGFVDVGERVHGGWQALGAVYVAPEAARLMAATGPVMTVTASVGEDLEAAAAAQHTYAAEVTGIQQRCAALRVQAVALNAAWVAVQDESTTVTLDERESGLTAAVAAEVAAWEAAQLTCANALRARSGSAPLLPVGPPGGPLEVVVAGTDQVLTFDDPVAGGMPPTSGYAADPVCTATGHFVEVEIDLDAPPAAALLTVTRVYGSRHARPGPFGRGWSSWASARLDREPDGVLFTGPDGRRARLARTADGYGRVPGIAADLVDSTDGGWRLSWFAGDTWRFEPDGRLTAVDDAGGDPAGLGRARPAAAADRAGRREAGAPPRRAGPTRRRRRPDRRHHGARVRRRGPAARRRRRVGAAPGTHPRRPRPHAHRK